MDETTASGPKQIRAPAVVIGYPGGQEVRGKLDERGSLGSASDSGLPSDPNSRKSSREEDPNPGDHSESSAPAPALGSLEEFPPLGTHQRGLNRNATPWVPTTFHPREVDESEPGGPEQPSFSGLGTAGLSQLAEHLGTIAEHPGNFIPGGRGGGNPEELPQQGSRDLQREEPRIQHEDDEDAPMPEGQVPVWTVASPDNPLPVRVIREPNRFPGSLPPHAEFRRAVHRECLRIRNKPIWDRSRSEAQWLQVTFGDPRAPIEYTPWAEDPFPRGWGYRNLQPPYPWRETLFPERALPQGSDRFDPRAGRSEVCCWRCGDIHFPFCGTSQREASERGGSAPPPYQSRPESRAPQFPFQGDIGAEGGPEAHHGRGQEEAGEEEAGATAPPSPTRSRPGSVRERRRSVGPSQTPGSSGTGTPRTQGDSGPTTPRPSSRAGPRAAPRGRPPGQPKGKGVPGSGLAGSQERARPEEEAEVAWEEVPEDPSPRPPATPPAVPRRKVKVIRSPRGQELKVADRLRRRERLLWIERALKWDRWANNCLKKIWMVVLLYLVFVMCIGAGQAFPVYDCDNQNTRISELDMRKPADCPEATKLYFDEEETDAQVVHVGSTMMVPSFKCSAFISKRVCRCGFNSLHYGCKDTVYNRLVEITPSECRAAVKAEEIRIRNRKLKLKLGQPTTETWYTRGNLDDNFNCETDTFTSGGVRFHNSYELTTLRVTLDIVRGEVDTVDGMVHFSNGLKAPYQDKMLRDYAEGIMVWETVDRTCSEQLSEVYKGPAKLRRRRDKKNGSRSGAVVMIENKSTGQYAGLVLKDPTNLCGVQCRETQEKGVRVCLLREHDDPIPGVKFRHEFDPTRADLAVQLGYLHLSTNFRFVDKFDDFSRHLCEVSRMSLFNKLQAIADGNKNALLDIFGPGHEIYIHGTTAYVAACEAVEARPFQYKNCTHEIPVEIYNGTRKFADPITMVVKDDPTVTVCSHIAPPKWYVGSDHSDHWLCANPYHSRCSAPKQMKPYTAHYSDTEALRNFTIGLGLGLWSQEALDRHKSYRRTLIGRDAVEAKITNVATGNGEGEGLGSVVDPSEYEDLAMGMSFHILPQVYYLGQSYHYIVGILLILTLTKYLISLLLRLYHIYVEEQGLSTKMIWAVMDTTWSLVYIPMKIAKAAWANLAAPKAACEHHLVHPQPRATAPAAHYDDEQRFLDHRAHLLELDEQNRRAQQVKERLERAELILQQLEQCGESPAGNLRWRPQGGGDHPEVQPDGALGRMYPDVNNNQGQQHPPQ